MNGLLAICTNSNGGTNGFHCKLSNPLLTLDMNLVGGVSDFTSDSQVSGSECKWMYYFLIS